MACERDRALLVCLPLWPEGCRLLPVLWKVVEQIDGDDHLQPLRQTESADLARLGTLPGDPAVSVDQGQSLQATTPHNLIIETGCI